MSTISNENWDRIYGKKDIVDDDNISQSEYDMAMDMAFNKRALG
jgi:hypothetical protein